MMRGLRRPRPLVAAVAALAVRSASSSCACVAPPADAAAYDVLLAGDATTATYANLTAAVLAGGGLARAANYTFAAGCGTAADLAACLPAWLDATNWTVVHAGAGADDVAAGASTDTYAADVAALGRFARAKHAAREVLVDARVDDARPHARAGGRACAAVARGELGNERVPRGARLFSRDLERGELDVEAERRGAHSDDERAQPRA